MITNCDDNSIGFRSMSIENSVIHRYYKKLIMKFRYQKILRILIKYLSREFKGYKFIKS